MAKGKLEFDLNDFDDRMSFERCVKSTDMVMVLWEILHNTKKSLYWKFESMEEKGETFESFKDRMKKAYKYVKELPKSDIVITHSKVTRAFQALSDRKQEIAQTLYNGQTADEVNGVTEPVDVETDEVQAQTEVEEPEQVEEPKEEE